MYTYIGFWYYVDGEWFNENPSSLTVGETVAKSSYLMLVMQDQTQRYHLLGYQDLYHLPLTGGLLDEVDKLVLNNPIKGVPVINESALIDIPDTTFENGIVSINHKTPLVFNTTTSFLTEDFNAGMMVLDYIDNVFATNDVTLGYIDNIVDFKLKKLSDLDNSDIHASLMIIGNTLTKVSDYFSALGHIITPREYRTEALMALLIEGNIHPQDVGLVGPYQSGALKSRLVASRIVKHPDIHVLTHPDKVPVQIRKTAVNTTRPDPTTEIIFRGNKPSTLKALGLLSSSRQSPKSITDSGVHLNLPVQGPGEYWQVSVLYPHFEK